MRYRGLKGVEAAVERQECVLAERDDIASSSTDNTVDFASFGPVGRSVTESRFLGNGLGIDAVTPRRRPQALLTMLYRSTDRLCRCGAAVKILSPSASFESDDKGAPSNPGIKHPLSSACAGLFCQAKGKIA